MRRSLSKHCSDDWHTQTILTLPWLPITENGWAVHAGPGTFLGLEDVLLEKGLASSIVAVTDVVLWRVSSKALKAILRSCPDLSLHLFRAAFGQLEARTEELQVAILPFPCYRDSMHVTMLQHASLPAGCLLRQNCQLGERAAATCFFALLSHVSLTFVDLTLEVIRTSLCRLRLRSGRS